MNMPGNVQDPRVVVSVGQCGYDNSRIASLVRSIDPAIGFQTTDTADETLELLNDLGERAALVLVNRVFDLDGASGMALIESIKQPNSGFDEVPVMLVSNYEQSQAEAIAHGALPGFGKAGLNAGETREKLAKVLTV